MLEFDWRASEKRTPDLLKILQTYGTHAKAFIPQLREIANTFNKDEEGFPSHMSKRKTAMVREAIKSIESSQDHPKLARLK